MTGELRFAELTTVKDGLLDSQVAHNTDNINGALQSQWEVIRDGLSQGASARAQDAKDNSLLTGVEIASSFGLGAGLAWAMKAGGRWTKAAEAGGLLFAGMMGYDLTRRGAAIHEAYANTSGDTLQGQAARKDAIAQYAGSGLVDYSLMFASGGLGVASVHYGPKMAAKLSTALEPLGKFGAMEPALQPARVNKFNIMDLGETGRFGAKEKVASVKDPIDAARERLEFPHRSVGLDQLQALVQAKQIAAHPEVRPLYDQMSQTLSKVDTIKPLLSKEEGVLAGLEKQLTEIRTLKPETQAVKSAETAINGVQADIQRLPSLREEQAALSRQIQESKTSANKDASAETKKGGKDKEPAVNVEELKTRRRELNETISNIQARSQELPKLQQRLAEAQDALAKRKAAVEAGQDAEVAAIQTQMKPLQESVTAKRSELMALSEQLKGLDDQIQVKADAVRPTLGDASGEALPSVPRYVKPKVEIPQVDRPALRKTEAKLNPPPAEAKPPLEQKAPTQKLEQADNRVKTERIEPKGDRNASKVEQVAPGVVTEAQVGQAFTEARKAVDDFAATHKRHTTALKKVNDYIETSFAWFASDAQAAGNAGKVAANVETMLGKLENWDRAPGWIRPADRAQIMQRNGFDAATMQKFDQWYQSQNKPFNDTRNMSPDRKLVDIQQHLSRRVAVESVKNWLRTSPDVEAAVSPIVQQGFQIMAEGKLPDGRTIPKGSDMIVFEQRKIEGPNGEQEAILPFAKDGQHMQRFDDAKISEGLRKLEAMKNEGPQSLASEDLYGFRLDHDPSRLMASGQQVGFAFLRPGGQYGKNILYMQFAEGIDSALIPKSLRQDSQNSAGTNTGVLYNMLRKAGSWQRLRQ